MGEPRPGVDVYGGWTSARLLVRLLYAIDSPWDLTEAGLTHTGTGETCVLQMRGREADGLARVQQGECPVRPSLIESELDGVDDHRSVIRVQALAGAGPLEASRAVLRCTAALVDAGGQAARCTFSGLALGGARVQALARMADAAAEAGDAATVREALYLALVHPLRRDTEGWCTRGMALLGHADVRAPGSVPEAVALDAMEALNLRVLAERPPADGDRLRAAPTRPAFRVRRGPDPRPPTADDHNPFGLWHLDAEGRSAADSPQSRG